MKEFDLRPTRSQIAKGTFLSIKYGVQALIRRDYGDRLIAQGLISQTLQEMGISKMTFIEKALGYTTIPAIPLAALKLLLMTVRPKK